MIEEGPQLQVDIRGLPGIWAAEWHWENVENLEMYEVGPRNPDDPEPVLVVQLSPLDEVATRVSEGS